MTADHGLLLGKPLARPLRASGALMRRHRAAMSLLHDTTEDERVRLLAMVVAPSALLTEAIDAIDERLDQGHEAANFNLGR